MAGGISQPGPPLNLHLSRETFTLKPSLDALIMVRRHDTLEATQVQIDGFSSQLQYKCHQNRVASVGD